MLLPAAQHDARSGRGDDDFRAAGAGMHCQVQPVVVEPDVDPLAAERHLKAHLADLDRQPWGEHQGVGADLQPGERTHHQVDGARHGAQVDTFLGGAALGVVQISGQGVTEDAPGSSRVQARQDRGVHDPAESGAVRGAGQVVVDGVDQDAVGEWVAEVPQHSQ